VNPEDARSRPRAIDSTGNRSRFALRIAVAGSAILTTPATAQAPNRSPSSTHRLGHLRPHRPLGCHRADPPLLRPRETPGALVRTDTSTHANARSGDLSARRAFGPTRTVRDSRSAAQRPPDRPDQGKGNAAKSTITVELEDFRMRDEETPGDDRSGDQARLTTTSRHSVAGGDRRSGSRSGSRTVRR
jgi:hypothetical protein